MPTPPLILSSSRDVEMATSLALSLAQAEQAIHDFTAGQVDAIVDPDGRAFLLRPAQERLRNEQLRSRAIVDSSGDAILVVNRAGAVVSQNRTAAQMLQRERDASVGVSIFELIDPDELLAFHSSFFNVIEGFVLASIVLLHLKRSDGAYCWVEALVTRLRERDATCVVITCREMNNHIQAIGVASQRETVLATQLLDRDRFLAVLSHELRTPLSPIGLGLDELQEEEHSPEGKATLQMIRRNLDLLVSLMDDLIDFTSVGNHKVRLSLKPVDLREAIALVLDLCGTELAETHIQVQCLHTAADSIVSADFVRLQQIMWNLVKNAVKFSTPGGVLKICTFTLPNNLIAIEFIDDGIGISPDLLPLIFDPFQQGTLPDERRSAGLGLGLYIARGMAEAQGGTLTAYSDGPGKGATFRLTLHNATPQGPALPRA